MRFRFRQKGAPEDAVAVRIRLPHSEEGDVALDGLFEEVAFAVELSGFSRPARNGDGAVGVVLFHNVARLDGCAVA